MALLFFVKNVYLSHKIEHENDISKHTKQLVGSEASTKNMQLERLLNHIFGVISKRVVQDLSSISPPPPIKRVSKIMTHFR